MPRYITFCFTLNSLSSAATQIENVCQLGQTVNLKQIKLSSIQYPHDAVGIRY